MKIDTNHTSPHFTNLEIAVEFLVLHYTACGLKQTLEIFKSSDKGVCAHFVLDTDGTVYDFGRFLNGPILRGAHAGKSHLMLNGTKFENFNQFSIGIEMINLNGNLIEYSDEQYLSLAELVRHLQKRFPILKNAERIVGHEHIAHWRGKADPGVMFNWNRFLTSVGLEPGQLHSFFACHDDDLEWLKLQGQSNDWSELSHQLEIRIASKAATERTRA
jgi:N-acetylmuramoyl-L-alanine amidase